MSRDNKGIAAWFKAFPGKFWNFFKKGGWFCLLMFFADLGTKLGMNAYFKGQVNPSNPVKLIPSVLELTLTYNTGAAWGTGAGNPTMRIIFAILSFVVGCVVIYLLAKYFDRLSPWKRYAIYLILAGDWGNFIDRAFYWGQIAGINGVVDWISVGNESWPAVFTYVCNWADICLTLGAVILVLAFIIEYFKDANKEKKATQEYLDRKKLDEVGNSYAAAEREMNDEIEAKEEKKMSGKADAVKSEDDLGDFLKEADNNVDGSEKKSDGENSEKDKGNVQDESFDSLSDFLKGE